LVEINVYIYDNLSTHLARVFLRIKLERKNALSPIIMPYINVFPKSIAQLRIYKILHASNTARHNNIPKFLATAGELSLLYSASNFKIGFFKVFMPQLLFFHSLFLSMYDSSLKF